MITPPSGGTISLFTVASIATTGVPHANASADTLPNVSSMERFRYTSALE